MTKTVKSIGSVFQVAGHDLLVSCRINLVGYNHNFKEMKWTKIENVGIHYT